MIKIFCPLWHLNIRSLRKKLSAYFLLIALEGSEINTEKKKKKPKKMGSQH